MKTDNENRNEPRRPRPGEYVRGKGHLIEIRQPEGCRQCNPGLPEVLVFMSTEATLALMHDERILTDLGSHWEHGGEGTAVGEAVARGRREIKALGLTPKSNFALEVRQKSSLIYQVEDPMIGANPYAPEFIATKYVSGPCVERIVTVWTSRNPDADPIVQPRQEMGHLIDMARPKVDPPTVIVDEMIETPDPSKQ